jgi:Domain of unknown function (DUF4440)
MQIPLSRPLRAALIALCCALLTACATGPSTAPAARVADPLDLAIAKLDHAVFDAFNRCSDKEQLKLHEGFFASDVEFYHDTGGVTFSRKAMIANTKANVCGKYRRELIDGSLRVYPVKDFGAIEQGRHRFCSLDGKKCEGQAEFTIIWQKDDAEWRITRVLSYGHRAND